MSLSNVHCLKKKKGIWDKMILSSSCLLVNIVAFEKENYRVGGAYFFLALVDTDPMRLDHKQAQFLLITNQPFLLG